MHILQSTYDPGRYVQFTADGDTIYAEGCFTDMQAIDFYISAASLKGIERSLEARDDNSFTAFFAGVPEDGVTNARAVIRLADDTLIGYRVEWDDGWFFGDNGLGEKTMRAVDGYYEISDGLSLAYVSASLDEDEIIAAQDRLKSIVKEVTFDLEDDYQKAKALNAWVAYNLYYDRDASVTEVSEETVSIARTLELRRTVCIGIANTYAALLEAAGIKAVNINGGAVNPAEGYEYEDLAEHGAHHEWVAFLYEAENRWVFVDPTWDRRSVYENGEYIYEEPVFKHFDMSPLAMSLDRRGDRAQLRNYFAYLSEPDEHDPAEHTTPPQTYAIPSAIRASAPVMREDDSLLYLIIGGMSAVAVLLVIIIIKLKR